MNFLQNAAKALTSDDVDYQYGDLKLGLQGRSISLKDFLIWCVAGLRNGSFSEHTLRSFVNYFEYFGSPDQRISRSDLETYLLDKGFPSDEQSVGAHIDRVRTVFRWTLSCFTDADCLADCSCA